MYILSLPIKRKKQLLALLLVTPLFACSTNEQQAQIDTLKSAVNAAAQRAEAANDTAQRASQAAASAQKTADQALESITNLSEHCCRK